MALTAVVVIIVIMACPEIVPAFALGALLALMFGQAQHVGRFPPQMYGPSVAGTPGPTDVAEAPRPNAMAGPPPLASGPGRAHEAKYQGAIDVDEYDTLPGLGHRDSRRGEAMGPPEGAPHFRRISPVYAAPACIDDEANDDTIDGDERLSYQALSRNDPTRPTAGTMSRRGALDQYLREEVEEADDREWWGRHEY
jgi:hypothetical protein